MDERILEQLENVPYNGEDAFEDLKRKIEYKLCMLSIEDIKRILMNLKKLKNWVWQSFFC